MVLKDQATTQQRCCFCCYFTWKRTILASVQCIGDIVCASATHTLYEHINTHTRTTNYLRIRTHSHEMKIIANRKKRANTLCLRSTQYLFTVSSAIKRFCFVFTLYIYVRDFDSNGFLCCVSVLFFGV